MWQYILFVLTLSLDTFCASVSYRMNKIKIPMFSVLIISLLCSGIVAISLILGDTLLSFCPPVFLKRMSAAILFLLGIEKLLEPYWKRRQDKRNSQKHLYNVFIDYEKADKDNSKDLSPREAVILSLALSLDGVTGGVAFALSKVHILTLTLINISCSILLIILGQILGIWLGKRMKIDISWLTALLFFILAFFRL